MQIDKNRVGLWRESKSFSLAIRDSAPFKTRMFKLPQVAIVPEFYAWDLTKSDPTGSRHLMTHESYMGCVGSGMGALDSNVMTSFDFNDVDISTGSGVSDTRCMTLRVASQDCSQTRITHMKMWVSDDSDFLVKDYKVGYIHSSGWLPGTTFTWNDCENNALETAVPTFQNLKRQDESLVIHASGDRDVSEFMYFAVACSGTILPGEYGGKYQRGFRIRCSYSLDNIFSLQDKTYGA